MKEIRGSFILDDFFYKEGLKVSRKRTTRPSSQKDLKRIYFSF